MTGERRLTLPEVRARYMTEDFGTFGYDIALAFERWLARERLSLDELRLEDVKRFVRQPGDKPIKRFTQNNYRSRVRHYLVHLHGHGFLSFDPAKLEGRHRKRIPELVARYVEQLRPINRPSTWRRYRAVLALIRKRRNLDRPPRPPRSARGFPRAVSAW